MLELYTHDMTAEPLGQGDPSGTREIPTTEARNRLAELIDRRPRGRSSTVRLRRRSLSQARARCSERGKSEAVAERTDARGGRRRRLSCRTSIV